MKPLNHFHRFLLLICLMLAGMSQKAQASTIVGYIEMDPITDSNGITYRIYRNATLEFYAKVGDKYRYKEFFIDYTGMTSYAFVSSLAGVTKEDVTIPEKVQNIPVYGFSENLSQEANTKIKTLRIEGQYFGADNSLYYYKKEHDYAENKDYYTSPCGTEARGASFYLLRLPNLEAIYFPTKAANSFVLNPNFFQNCPKLKDFYVQDDGSCLSFLGNCGTAENLGNITLHVPNDKYYFGLKERYPLKNFKDVVPLIETFPVKVSLTSNVASNVLTIYDSGSYESYEAFQTGEGRPPYERESVRAGQQTTIDFPAFHTLSFEVFRSSEKQNCQVNYKGETLKPSLPTTTTTERYNIPSISSSDAVECIVSDKLCEVSIATTEVNYGGTVTYVENGAQKTVSVVDGTTIKCSYGSTMTLTLPYETTRTLSDIQFGSTTYTPTQSNYRYTQTLTVPSQASTTLKVNWNSSEDEDVNPVIKVVRTGEGDVTFIGQWGYDQERDFHNSKTVPCLSTITHITLPDENANNKSDGVYWAYEIQIKPAKGQVVRRVLVGEVDPDNNKKIAWEENVVGSRTSRLIYDEQTGTYTYSMNLLEDYMYGFDIGDYSIIVDIGPESIVIEEGNKQTFLRKGGEGRVYLNYEECSNDFEPDIDEGTSTITIPDYDNDNDCTYAYLFVELGADEVFTAYRDGFDVSKEFAVQNGNEYVYVFDQSEQKRQASVWTIIIEKNPYVKTSFKWNVTASNLQNGAQLIETFTAATTTDYIFGGSRDYDIQLSDQLQSVRLQVAKEQDRTLQLLRNGYDLAEELRQDNDYYYIEVAKADLMDANWFVGYVDESKLPTLINVTTEGGGLNTAMLYESARDCGEYGLAVPDGEQTTLKLFYDKNMGCGTYFQLDATPNEGQTVQVLLNGEDITDKLKSYLSKSDGYSAVEGDEDTKVLIYLKDYTEYYLDFNLGSDYQSGDVLNFHVRYINSSENLDGDINKDGKITIADVTKLVNIILGKE